MGLFDGFKKFRADKKVNKGRYKYEAAPTKDMLTGDWGQIDVLLEQRGPSQLRQALITADKAFDNALKNSLSGENYPERLKNARDKFDFNTYDKLWKAHKMRNALVHESGFEPPAHMVIDAVETLRKGMQGLGVKV